MITGELKNRIDGLWDVFAAGKAVMTSWLSYAGRNEERGSVVEIFTDMTVWMGIKKVIDTINANAMAA